MQPCQVNEDCQDETVERHEGEHGHPQGQFHKEEHDHRDRHHQREECLQFWQDEHVEGQHALREFLQLEPFSLKKYLDKALVPARALFNKLLDGVGRLFTGDELVVVEHPYLRVCNAQANAKVGVFRQTGLIPAAHLFHQFPPHEHRVASQRCHAQAREKVQRRLEPEEVFQHVEEAEPLSIVVHQLYPTLYHVYLLVEHGGIDDIQNVGMGFVLCIEDSHYVPARHLQRQVQPMRFVDRLVIEDNELDIGIAQLADFGLRLRDSTRVVFAADRHDLYQSPGIVKVVHLLDRLAIHILFMPGRQEDGK